MTNFEMVEKLRQKANVSYEEAKAALEAANWDLLDAIVLLEREGKVPEDDARFTTRQARNEKNEEGREGKKTAKAVKGGMRSVGAFLRRVLNYGNNNFIVASRDGREIVSLPITAFVLLLFFPPFWLVVALLIVGLVCGVRFSIRGAHPSNEKVNQYIHKAEDAASRVSQAWQENAQDASKE